MNLKYFCSINLLVIILYIFCFWISLGPNSYIQSLFSETPYVASASLIFFAHGIRVLSILLWGYYVYLGVFLAQVFTGYLFLNFQTFDLVNIFLSLCSLIPFPIVSYALFRTIKGVEFEKIKLKNIILLSIFSSCLSSYFSTSYKNFINPQDRLEFITEASNFIIGDVLGAFILFYFSIWIYRSIYLIRNQNSSQ